MNLDYAHERLIAALQGIVDGKGKDDVVAGPNYGRPINIVTALRDAQALDEPFHDEHLQIAEAALKARGLKRSINNKRTIAAELLHALQGNK